VSIARAFLQNHFQYTIQISHYISIWKSHFPITLPCNFLRSLSIIFLLLGVRISIEFNHQPGFDATKIDNVISHRMLTPKFESA